MLSIHKLTSSAQSTCGEYFYQSRCTIPYRGIWGGWYMYCNLGFVARGAAISELTISRHPTFPQSCMRTILASNSPLKRKQFLVVLPKLRVFNTRSALPTP